MPVAVTELAKAGLLTSLHFAESQLFHQQKAQRQQERSLHMEKTATRTQSLSPEPGKQTEITLCFSQSVAWAGLRVVYFHFF